MYDFLAQSEISIRAVFQLRLHALKPNLAHILRNVAHARVVQEIGFGRDKTEMNHDGKSGDLPGAVGYESMEKIFGFLWRGRVPEFAAPGAFAGGRLGARFVGRVGNKVRPEQLKLLRTTPRKDAVGQASA